MAETDSQPIARAPKSGRPVVPHTLNWRQRFGAWLVFVLLRALMGTVRCRWEDRSGLHSKAELGPSIYCTPHNRLALALKTYRSYVRPRSLGAGLAALVSASRDGGFLARILELFGVLAVRGSSSRRGAQALLELTSVAARGYDLAITPDGPRGPCYGVQEGVIALAQLTGRPVFPVSYHLNWKIRLRSWDRFQVPLPFARCDIVIGQPLQVPRDATLEERERLRQQLEATLRGITRD